ncbi:hypothetical protein D3C80_1965440 [compost metagenome]
MLTTGIYIRRQIIQEVMVDNSSGKALVQVLFIHTSHNRFKTHVYKIPYQLSSRLLP